MTDYGTSHLHRVSHSYAPTYNDIRTRRSLDKDAPLLSPGSANRIYQFTRDPWRTSSPLRSGLSFRYTQVAQNADKKEGNCEHPAIMF
jgi:hypothetical protein